MITPALLDLISPFGSGKTLEDLARELGHPYHQNKQKGLCDCCPPLWKQTEELRAQGKIYRIGKYFWQPTTD